MRFRILAEKNMNDRAVFFYDTENNTLEWENGTVFFSEDLIKEYEKAAVSLPFGKDVPLRKSRKVSTLKIQLGLSCNYACSYCSQRFVERADETSRKHVEAFMLKLEGLDLNDLRKIEFWGGEPLVYVKTLRPLVDAFDAKYEGRDRKPRYTMITNGSLLTDEIADWLYDKGFSISISHDGPGQAVRGPDPFDDAEKKDVILRFWRRMHRENRISFNAMLNGSNTSRKAVHDWFVALTGDPTVMLGEGGLIDAYDVDGIANSLRTKQAHFDFRRQAFNEIRDSEGDIGFRAQMERIDEFTRSILGHRPLTTIGQKCGMENEDVLAVDLRGNVITCQNTSAAATAPNGAQHMAGNIVDIDKVRVRSATHWRNRSDCASCPVIHLCQGSCMYLEDELWDASCDGSYSDNVVVLALAIEALTGYIPAYIDADHLPPERRDIWGTLLEHVEEDGAAVLKPIRIVNEKIIVEGVEVFTASQAVEVA